MPEHPLSEAAQRELDNHLANERKEILSRAYMRNYADKNPGPFDADTIADAIAQIHTSTSSAQNGSITPIVEYRERRAYRLRFILDLYQVIGVLIGAGGLTYAVYQVVLLLLPKTSESGSYYPGLSAAFVFAYLGFSIALLSRFLAKRWIQYRTEVWRSRSSEQLTSRALEETPSTLLTPEFSTGFVSTFLFEWQQLEKAIRTLYQQRFGDDAAGLRDMIRSIEDVEALSNYEAHQTLRGLQMRNKIVHGGPVGSLPTNELRSVTAEIRELRRKLEAFEPDSKGPDGA